MGFLKLSPQGSGLQEARLHIMMMQELVRNPEQARWCQHLPKRQNGRFPSPEMMQIAQASI